MDEISGLFLAALVALFLLVACVWRLRQLARGSRVRVLVFEGGLARFDGENLVSCRWDEIETVEWSATSYRARGIPLGTRFVITLKLASGGQMVFDGAREHLPAMESLSHRISKETTTRLLPRTLAALKAGQTIAFGELGVSRLGIHCGDRALAWGEVENISAEPQLCISRRRGGWLDFWSRWSRRGFAIPNLELFLLLAEHYLQKERGDVAWEAEQGRSS